MLVEEKYSKEHLSALFDKYIKKLRITPDWDIKLEFVEDKTWRKTGDFKIDCDDKKAILLLNIRNPKQENLDFKGGSLGGSLSGDGVRTSFLTWFVRF